MERKVQLADEVTVDYKKINQIVSAVIREHQSEIEFAFPVPQN